MDVMANEFVRPTVKYDPLDDESPFLLFSGEGGEVQQWLTRSDRRALALDLDRAAEEDRAARSCDTSHAFWPDVEQPLLPPGAVAVRCRDCPTTGVLHTDGTVAPVEQGSAR